MSILWQKLKRSQGSVHAEREVRFEPFHWWYLLMIITLSWELKLLSFIYNKKPTHKNGVALSVLQYETTLSPISESSVGPAVSPWVDGWGSWPVERNDVTCEHWTELKWQTVVHSLVLTITTFKLMDVVMRKYLCTLACEFWWEHCSLNSAANEGCPKRRTVWLFELCTDLAKLWRQYTNLWEDYEGWRLTSVILLCYILNYCNYIK